MVTGDPDCFLLCQCERSVFSFQYRMRHSVAFGTRAPTYDYPMSSLQSTVPSFGARSWYTVKVESYNISSRERLLSRGRSYWTNSVWPDGMLDGAYKAVLLLPSLSPPRKKARSLSLLDKCLYHLLACLVRLAVVKKCVNLTWHYD